MGKAKQVVLVGKYLGAVSAYDVKRIAFKFKTKINRSDFGLTWNDIVESGPVVGAEVEIDLSIQAKRKSDL